MSAFFFFFSFFVLLCVVESTDAQPGIHARTIVSDLDTPWEVSWGPDGWLWYTERSGTVSRVHPETGEARKVLTIPSVAESGENGLLGMALYENGEVLQVYLIYTYHSDGKSSGRLERYDFDGSVLINPVTIIEGFPSNSFHTGSRLRIIQDKLFVTYGDVANAVLAQDLQSLAGKTLRVNLDGSVPADNPFHEAGFPTNLLWSWGHRNSQGLVMGPNGILYASEHGAAEDDEINIIEKGRNYGWPHVFGFCDTPEEEQFCLDSNIVEPIAAWTPTLAVCGLEFYDGDRFPAWKNSLLMVTLKEQELRQLQLSPDGKTVLEQNVYLDEHWGRLRDVCVAPDGRVFVAANRVSSASPSGRIVEVYSREEPLPVIGEIQFDGNVLCARADAALRFSTDGEFEPDNIFSVIQVDPDSPDDVKEILSSFPGTEGGEFRLENLFLYDSAYLRIVSSNPYTKGEVFGPLEVYTPPLLSLRSSTGTTMICETEGTLELSVPNATPEVEYRWSTGATAPTITVSDSGTYTVEVTWPNGCSYIIDTMITKGSKPEIPLIGDQKEFILCDGDSVLLSVEIVDMPSLVVWSNGVHTTHSIWAKNNGRYWVRVSDEAGCSSYSDTVEVIVKERPAKPEIVQGSNMLASSPAAHYQWYRDGEPLDGETEQLLTVTLNGLYWVEVTNEGGCSNWSDSIEMIVTGVDQPAVTDGGLRVYPQPVMNRVTLEFESPVTGPVRVTLADMNGREVRRFRISSGGQTQWMFSLEDLPSGPYLLRVEVGSAVSERVIVKR